MRTAEQIVTDFAARSPTVGGECSMCSSRTGHQPGCVWLEAYEWVRRPPEKEAPPVRPGKVHEK